LITQEGVCRELPRMSKSLERAEKGAIESRREGEFEAF
jgi:hypothetical protein